MLPAVLAGHEQADRLRRAEREARNAARLRGHGAAHAAGIVHRDVKRRT